MKITGAKRWFIVILCALLSGVMVYVDVFEIQLL